jgi:hypothetical protein
MFEVASPTASLWVIIEGNVIEGFVHHGPFTSEDRAAEYGSCYLKGDWVAAELTPPRAESAVGVYANRNAGRRA